MVRHLTGHERCSGRSFGALDSVSSGSDWSPGTAVPVLFSWKRRFTLIVLLHTQLYKCYQRTEFNAGGVGGAANPGNC